MVPTKNLIIELQFFKIPESQFKKESNPIHIDG